MQDLIYDRLPESYKVMEALSEIMEEKGVGVLEAAADLTESYLLGSGVVLSRDIHMDGSGTGTIRAEIRGEHTGPALVFLTRPDEGIGFGLALSVFRHRAEAVHRGEETLRYPLRLILVLDEKDSYEETAHLASSGLLHKEDLILGLVPTGGRILDSHMGRMEVTAAIGPDPEEDSPDFDAIGCMMRLLHSIRLRTGALQGSKVMGNTRVRFSRIEGEERTCRAQLIFHLAAPCVRDDIDQVLSLSRTDLLEKTGKASVLFETGIYYPPVEGSASSRILVEVRDSIAAETGIRPEGETGPGLSDTAWIAAALESAETLDYTPPLETDPASEDQDALMEQIHTARAILERLIDNVNNGPLEEGLKVSSKIFSGLENLPEGRASDRVVPGCLVLEGGAFRGLYTQGVLDALMEAGINLQTVIGVSAGAMSGMCYVSGQIGRGARINLRYRHDDRYVGLRAFRRNRGLIGFDFVFFGMDDAYPFDEERFRDPNRRFLAAVTSCETGETLYFDRDSCGDIYQAVRASASMPFVSRPVEVDGIPCLDGGCGDDKIPVRWAMDQGFDKIVVVRTRERGYRIEADSGRSAAVARRFYRKRPLFAEKLAANNTAYNALVEEIEGLEEEGRIFVIAPSAPPEVGRVESDMEKLGALYYMGYHDARTCLPSLKAYLGLAGED